MEDTIKLPLDADGVPIRPGDVVYPIHKRIKLEVVSLEINAAGDGPIECMCGNAIVYWKPTRLAHYAPDTLETIEASIRELIELSEEFALSEIPSLMERIKRMVER